MYAILDIETTGGNSNNEKITEIAVFIHDGEKVVEEFHTLLDPEKNIPPYIVRLTGITDEMVHNSPKFYEIAKQLVELTEDKVIVAHNSAFDYNFIRREYKNLGFNYNRKTLCTVKLSRKLIPGKKSYSLGKLCDDLGIEIKGRHRAAGDALATVKLFEILLKTGAPELQIKKSKEDSALDNLQLNLDKNWLKKLPEQTGVYYFYNDNKELIYIGKSKNIKQRVFSHLTNNATRKAIEMKNNIADVAFEITGSELVALLKESEEIKKHKPLYNRAQRRSLFNYGIFANYDVNGYIVISQQKTNNSSRPLSTYTSAIEAKNALYQLAEKYMLCQKLCGLYDTDGACFHYSIKKCKGACCEKESAEEYNQRATQAIKTFDYKFKNFVLIDEGKDDSEKSIVLVENGKYCGYGFADLEMTGNDLETLKESVKPFNDNRDVHQIIKSYLQKNKVQKVIRF